MGVARSVARRYRDRSIPLEDLEQVAYVALVRAARKFDIGQERDFLAYAVPTISGEVKRYFRDHGWTIRPPRRVQEIQSRVVEANERGHEKGATTTPEVIADELGLEVDDVVEALRAEGCFRPASLDAPLTADGAVSWANGLRDDDDGDRMAMEARVVLAPLLRELGERDRTILRLRFVEDRTQQEIGAELGVTQMQVSRLLARIISQLREAATGRISPA